MSTAQARRFIDQAVEDFATGNFREAFDMYSRALTIKPDLKILHEKQFLIVLMYFVDYLEHRGETERLFQIYRQALTIFPDHADILIDIGRYLLSQGFHLEAWKQFQEGLNQKPDSVIAEFQMNVIKAHLLHRWHYRMLNDKLRNNVYRVAIRESVKPRMDRVLDLGTGTGLLAMYTAQCNPASIIGIEMNSTLSEIATHVITENNFRNITIVNKSSYDVTDIYIGGKSNLLITEMFDAGLFGEDVVPSLVHAWLNLLHSDARILPTRAEFFVRGVQCNSLMTRYYLNEQARKLLNINFINVLASYDSYDCSDISHYKELQYVTEPQLLLKVNFNDFIDLETKFNQIEEYSVELIPRTDGVVDTIIGWFTLYLTDEVNLTTDPTLEDRAKAWQQAVFCNFLPMQVIENTPFNVKFQLVEGKKLDLVSEKLCDAKISENMMRFLNDTEYMNMIVSCVDTAFAYLQQLADVSTLAIADLSPFPMFGLMLLKKGIKILYCQGETKEDCKFFKKVFDANGIKGEHYRIINNNKYGLGNAKFHAIYFNIFDVSGYISREKVKRTHAIKMVHLIEGGLFMPYCISVMGQIVNSPSLDMSNRVYDDNTNFRIACHMNKFQLSVNYEIDYTNLEFTALSDPVGLGVCGGMKSGVIGCAVQTTGNANALLCWYDIELLQNCGFITTRRSNSFIDAIAFLANPEVAVVAGDVVDIICCVDNDQSFKFIIDVENEIDDSTVHIS